MIETSKTFQTNFIVDYTTKLQASLLLSGISRSVFQMIYKGLTTGSATATKLATNETEGETYYLFVSQNIFSNPSKITQHG